MKFGSTRIDQNAFVQQTNISQCFQNALPTRSLVWTESRKTFKKRIKINFQISPMTRSAFISPTIFSMVKWTQKTSTFLKKIIPTPNYFFRFVKKMKLTDKLSEIQRRRKDREMISDTMKSAIGQML